VNNLTQDILDIKEEIEQGEKERTLIEGQLQNYFAALKTKWQCVSLEEAQAKLDEMKKESDKIKTKIDKIKNQLDDLGWEV